MQRAFSSFKIETGGEPTGSSRLARALNSHNNQMNTAAPSYDDTQSTRSYSIISSAAATTKSARTEDNHFRQLMGQLVRRILVASRVSPNEWPVKESLLLSMSESILSRYTGIYNMNFFN